MDVTIADGNSDDEILTSAGFTDIGLTITGRKKALKNRVLHEGLTVVRTSTTVPHSATISWTAITNPLHINPIVQPKSKKVG
jgi:hypothetical protein